MQRFKSILVVLNVLLVILSIGAYFSPYVHPQNSSILPVLGLGYPALLFTHFLTMIVWLFWDKRWLLLSGISLVLGISSCQKIFTISIPDAVGDQVINIASFNANFSKPIALAADSEQEQMGQEFEDFLKTLDDIHVLCVQEFGWRSESHILSAMIFPYKHKVDNTTVAILSKVPFVATGVVDFHSNIANTCVWADLDMGSETIRVYTTLLESNRQDGKVPKAIVQEDPEDVSNAALLGILKHYQRFSGERVSQSQLINQHRRKSPHPSIVCGDINDTPQSRVYKVLKDDMRDTFVEEGFGIGSTFGGRIPALRIDYIFVDQFLAVRDHVIHKTDYSDHYLQRAVIDYGG